MLVSERAIRRKNPVGLENIEGWTGRFIPSDSEFQGDGVSFQKGDILFGKLRPYLAKVLLAESSGEAVGDFHVLRPERGVNGRYLQNQILTSQFISIVDSSTYGAKMPRASWGFMADMPCLQPPDDESELISRFIIHETGKIDQLIEKQSRLITLLKEKRQAVISHVVTKGLNPDVPLKDSGVEWFGDVPKHWKLSRLKHLVQDYSGIQMGPFGGMLKDLDEVNTGFKVYGQENTISGDFTKGSRWISEDRFYELANYHLITGDIVLTRKGSLGNARLIDSLPSEGIIDSDTIRLRVSKSVLDSPFLSFLLHHADYIAKQIMLTRRGAILPGLNTETIANLVVALRCLST